jgi:uncharacterized repeat protein (TIGR03803 family)
MHRNNTRTVLTTTAFLACLGCTAHAAPAKGLQVLYSFTAIPDGALPGGGPTYLHGTLYGVTNNGGTADSGAVYAVDAKTGKETIIYSFANTPDGTGPSGELIVQAGELAGTTALGGGFGGGIAFQVNPTTGAETIIHSFGSGTDGAMPAAGLIYQKGNFYGTTTAGGASGNGTVFAINARTGTEKVLYSFAGGSDGATPFAGLLFLNGFLYGTTYFGGPTNDGTVFKVDAKTGAETVLHAFTGGGFHGNPSASLIYANGLLYGTTAHSPGNGCGGSGCGTVFSTDPATGTTTTVYNFKNVKDGEDPEGRLAALSGLLYGTTETGGPSGLGTLFQLDPQTGIETKLRDFNGVPDGQNPLSLTVHHGVIYGTAKNDGNGGFGTVFRFKS